MATHLSCLSEPQELDSLSSVWKLRLTGGLRQYSIIPPNTTVHVENAQAHVSGAVFQAIPALTMFCEAAEKTTLQRKRRRLKSDAAAAAAAAAGV
eukprot:TRINITY_DN29215_c0_g1_i2.p2 TRINITY_DN29215_c0_g1~~TRINITY_DN29215_c0_g1_i2.p2  ORF type:complete len:107 (+),score=23.77 TRINITY_DN29215_c0_g1_i2:39-323(+)